VPTRVFPRDQDRELERVREAQLRQVARGGDRHQHVPAFQRTLECCVRMTGRARSSSVPGPDGRKTLSRDRLLPDLKPS
jgi:hypothetical protein